MCHDSFQNGSLQYRNLEILSRNTWHLRNRETWETLLEDPNLNRIEDLKFIHYCSRKKSSRSEECSPTIRSNVHLGLLRDYVWYTGLWTIFSFPLLSKWLVMTLSCPAINLRLPRSWLPLTFLGNKSCKFYFLCPFSQSLLLRPTNMALFQIHVYSYFVHCNSFLTGLHKLFSMIYEILSNMTPT